MLSQTSTTTCTMKKTFFILLISFVAVARGQSLLRGRRDMSATETFDLPECYDGPVLIQKDSSDINMCYYDEDMVQIHDMKQTEVTIGINNVWVTSTLPEELRVFEHGADGLQCLDNEGEDVDVTSGESKLTVQCYQENEDDPLSPFLAVIDVVITDSIICGSNSVAHPCYSDDQEILESCSWRIVIPCCPTTMCTDNPTDTPTDSFAFCILYFFIYYFIHAFYFR